jgi:hypothetical protein
MNFTAKVGIMSSFYPFQLRVNAILLDNGQINSNIIYMAGFPTLCNQVCLEQPVRQVIESFEPFEALACYEHITDAQLTPSVLAAYDKLKPVL